MRSTVKKHKTEQDFSSARTMNISALNVHPISPPSNGGLSNWSTESSWFEIRALALRARIISNDTAHLRASLCGQEVIQGKPFCKVGYEIHLHSSQHL